MRQERSLVISNNLTKSISELVSFTSPHIIYIYARSFNTRPHSLQKNQTITCFFIVSFAKVMQVISKAKQSSTLFGDGQLAMDLTPGEYFC